MPVIDYCAALRSDSVEAGDGNVSRVVAVALIRFCEAVHVQQLPVCHLPVRVKNLLAFLNGAHTNHLQTVLRKTGRMTEEGENG